MIASAVSLSAVSGCELALPYPGSETELGQLACSNGFDDDWNGATDCDDRGCAMLPRCWLLRAPELEHCASRPGTADARPLSSPYAWRLDALGSTLSGGVLTGGATLLTPATGALSGTHIELSADATADEVMVRIWLLPISALAATGTFDAASSVHIRLTNAGFSMLSAGRTVEGSWGGGASMPIAAPHPVTFDLADGQVTFAGTGAGGPLALTTPDPGWAPAEPLTLVLQASVGVTFHDLRITRPDWIPCGHPVPQIDAALAETLRSAASDGGNRICIMLGEAASAEASMTAPWTSIASSDGGATFGDRAVQPAGAVPAVAWDPTAATFRAAAIDGAGLALFDSADCHAWTMSSARTTPDLSAFGGRLLGQGIDASGTRDLFFESGVVVRCLRSTDDGASWAWDPSCDVALGSVSAPRGAFRLGEDTFVAAATPPSVGLYAPASAGESSIAITPALAVPSGEAYAFDRWRVTGALLIPSPGGVMLIEQAVGDLFPSRAPIALQHLVPQ